MAVKGNKIRGITVEIGADTDSFVKSIKSLDGSLKTINSKLKDVNKLLKLDPSNVELLSQKQKALNEAITTTEKKLGELKTALSKATTTDQQDALKREIIETQQKLSQYRGELKQVESQLDGTADATKDLENKTERAGETAENASNGGWTVFKQMLADLGTRVISSLIDGFKKLGNAIIDTGKQAISSYAEYEQLVGGVKKLFGDASDDLLENARKAYETAGMSVNQYIQGATSFSAALINSLDGDMEEAARLTDIAMRSISDSVNTFGVYSIENLQDVYKNLAKGTYTTLDNLLLGYSGTKSGMEQLIADANEYAETIGLVGDLSMDSFADIILAIDLVQQKQGIAGTTAEEAASTISGSLGMVKASWQNVLTAIADPEQDLGAIFDVFLEAVDTFWENIKPRLETVINKMLELFNEKIYPLIQKYLPPLIEYISKVLDENSPIIEEMVANILSMIGAGISKWFANLLLTIITSIVNIYNTLEEMKAYIWQLIIKLLDGILQNVVKGFGQLGEKISGAWENIKQKTVDVWTNITTTIKTKIEDAKNFVGDMIEKMKNFFNFQWELPKIKLPHFRVSGSANPLNWLSQGVPKISVDWYKKAQNQPYLFNSPSVIGVGDVPEVVVGADYFKQLAAGTGSTINNNITVNANVNSDVDIKDLAYKISNEINLSVQRRANVWR